MSSLSTLPKGDSAWLLRKSIQRIMQQVSVLETNIGSSTTGNSIDKQVIFNDNGVLRGDSGLQFNPTTDTLQAGLLIVPGNTQLATVGTLYVGTILNPKLKVDVAGTGETTIASATITGALTVDTTTLVVNPAGYPDRVGIGTASPTELLHIFGTGTALIEGTAGIYAKAITKVGAKSWQFGYRSGTAQYEIQEDGVERYTIGNGGTPHTWYIGASTAMTLNSTGLGVGVAPELKLRVDGPDAAPATSGSSTTNGAFRIGAQGASTNLCVDAGVTTTSGVYGWFQARSRANYATNYDLVLNPNGGNVGIGVAPSYKLDVQGADNSIIAQFGGTSRKINFTTSANGAFANGFFNFVSTSSVGAFSFQNTNGTHLTIDSAGNVGIGVTPAGTGGCLQLKSGITFPATQVASSDANTLDDYEEGTWTPTVAASSGTPTTVTIGTCKYTKIGRQVICTFDFIVVDKGTASGSLIFTLPFASDNFVNCGSFRENGLTGNMGQIFRNSTSDVAAFLYNNVTVWVDGYKVLGTYSYCI